jgi:glucose/mannose transport system substrate-binding protein
LVGLAASLAFACSGGDDGGGDGDGDSGDGDGDAREQVEIMSWWNAPGEAEALRALLDVHSERNPDVDIFNSSQVGGEETQAEIEKRLADGNPPDVFQEVVADLGEILATDPEALESLDDLFENNGWNDAVVPAVLDLIKADGKIYAMPVGIHRDNSLFFNQSLMKANSIDPPTTIAELLTACEDLNAAGVTPLAMGGQGWIVEKACYSIAAGVMGPAEFQT